MPHHAGCYQAQAPQNPTGGYTADYKFDLTPYANGTEKLQMSQGYDLHLTPPNFTSSSTGDFPNNNPKTENKKTIIEEIAIPGAAILAAAAGFFCMRKRCKNNAEQQPLLSQDKNQERSLQI